MNLQPTVLRIMARIAVATAITLLAIAQVRPDPGEVAGTVAARLMQKADLELPDSRCAEYSWGSSADSCPGIQGTDSQGSKCTTGSVKYAVDCEHSSETGRVKIDISRISGEVGAASVALEGEVPDWTSLVPPILAVVWAFVLGQALPALAFSVLAGSFVLMGGDVFSTLTNAAVDQVAAVAFDISTLQILLFTSALIGLVQICVVSGGIPAFVRWLSGGNPSRRRTQRATALMGTLIFFDDYANTMVVGGAMRPLADKTRTSREKLAFLVDSTAAPIAGVAVISTWIGVEIGLFDGQIQDFLGTVPNGYAAFFAVLPFRFYCLMTLALVIILAWTGRDFGPMLKAEVRASMVERPPEDELNPNEESGGSPINDRAKPVDGMGPVFLVIVGILVAMLVVGANHSPRESGSGLFAYLVQVFTAASDYGLEILAYVGTAGMFVSALWARVRCGLPFREAAAAVGKGLKILAPTLGVLVLAMTLRKVTDDLSTGVFLAALLKGTSAMILPAVVFCLAAFVAFSTGSSWATMGLLVPVALPLASTAVQLSGASTILILATAAAVLDGAIFGDHCSPISDTTVMSSAATSCDHMAHVRTQVPYAVLSMAAAVVCGYGIGVGLLESALIGYAIGITMLLLVVRILGKDPEEIAAQHKAKASAAN